MDNFQGQQMGSGEHDPSAQKRFHRTNEFFHRASEAMGLPWDVGKPVTQTILRNVIRRISPNEARHLISQLPHGLQEECGAFTNGPLKSITAEKIKRDINNAAGIQGINTELIAHSFWAFLTEWFNEFSNEHRGETHDVLDQLPGDIKDLLTGVSRH